MERLETEKDAAQGWTEVLISSPEKSKSRRLVNLSNGGYSRHFALMNKKAVLIFSREVKINGSWSTQATKGIIVIAI